MSDRPMTVRLPLTSRNALVEVSSRTCRSQSMLLNECIADLAHAFILDEHVFDPYMHTRDCTSRVSLITSAASATTLQHLSQLSARKPGVIARVGWLRWLNLHGVDEIARWYGAVRPGVDVERSA
ncbi:hypothetical protein [Gordonia otitidis]|nr:hypothetical protein [Gordonia otitidis]